MQSAKKLFSFSLILTLLLATASVKAQKDIVDIAIGSKNHTTLVAALKAADLVSTLKGKGPFTVFAPTNDAFNKLPKGTLESLLKPENKAKLASILTYHVVSGNIDAAALKALIKKGNGKAALKTINGQDLTAYVKDGKVIIEDASGGKAEVITADLKGSNGVIHVTNAVSLPK
jgi:uncharacterized surface protein with fasciclin (FAS1) repeats